MSSPLQQMKTTLKSRGFSITKPRSQVFAALLGNENLTMHQLVALCPTIDRATIYRTIELFEELGVVKRLQIGWKYRLELADSFVHHHHHMTCNGCGVVIALEEDNELERRLLSLADGLGFTAQDHQLEIRGLCRACSVRT